MIPFSLVSGHIEFADGTSTDVSFTEISGKHICFRLPRRKSYIATEIDSITVTFYFRHLNKTDSIRITTTDIFESDKTEYYTEYRAETAESKFAALCSVFTSDYMEYVESRLCLEDNEIAEKYTGYPAENESVYTCSFDEWKHRVFNRNSGSGSEIWKTASILFKERAVCLQDKESYTEYLSMDRCSFLQQFACDSGLDSNSFIEADINCLYIGNETCSQLQPEIHVLLDIIRKAHSENMHTVIVMPLLRSGMEDNTARFLKHVKQFSKGMYKNEIVLNDIGTAEIAENVFRGKCLLRMGTLFNKKTADPRQKWYNGAKTVSKNMLNSTEYLQMLKKEWNIEHFSAELWINTAFPQADFAVHIPYVRTNTAGTCTLHAVCESGKRSVETDTCNCRTFCRDRMFMYPEMLETIGVYNSIYTVYKKTLTDESVLYDAAENGADRIVFNFLQ